MGMVASNEINLTQGLLYSQDFTITNNLFPEKLKIFLGIINNVLSTQVDDDDLPVCHYWVCSHWIKKTPYLLKKWMSVL